MNTEGTWSYPHSKSELKILTLGGIIGISPSTMITEYNLL